MYDAFVPLRARECCCCLRADASAAHDESAVKQLIKDVYFV